MSIPAIIFDLDGTLLDTLDDLWHSTCYALRSCGMPERSREEVRQFVGNGVRRLIERAVPEGTSLDRIDECFACFKAHYVEHCQDNTHLYLGIPGMLQRLHAMGIPMAIVSNKLQAGVDELHERYFKDVISVAIGEREGMARKPAPDMVRMAISELGLSSDDLIYYVGDSDVDLLTARNAQLPCISVLWGFRDEQFLLAHGANCCVSHPAEIVDRINDGSL